MAEGCVLEGTTVRRMASQMELYSGKSEEHRGDTGNITGAELRLGPTDGSSDKFEGGNS
jgi:hypothetical protein